ncbi:MAG: VWA domain-containing protein, partial [Xanthomonadales bacterium]|nr:VWA domain-containing protein [Xanthomonadales bacterium]
MRFALPLLFSLLFATSSMAGENMMLVLDASGSMWGQIGGKTKVEIARETVAEVLGNWKSENALGLVAYGHRRKGDCSDIETLIEPGPLDRAAFMATVNGLNAKGMTPLSAAVRHAAETLRSSERKATVILVSDGEETCNLDPCAVGAELE